MIRHIRRGLTALVRSRVTRRVVLVPLMVLAPFLPAISSAVPAGATTTTYGPYPTYLGGLITIRVVDNCTVANGYSDPCRTVYGDYWDGHAGYNNFIWDVLPNYAQVSAIWPGNPGFSRTQIVYGPSPLYDFSAPCNSGASVCGIIWGVDQSNNNAFCEYRYGPPSFSAQCRRLNGGSYYDARIIDHAVYTNSTITYAVTGI